MTQEGIIHMILLGCAMLSTYWIGWASRDIYHIKKLLEGQIIRTAAHQEREEGQK